MLPTSDVWYLNAGGYTHYRIPSVCRTPSGRLLAFTEARRDRLSRSWEWEYALVKDEVLCLMKHSDDQGRTWPISRELDDGPCANLALVALPEGQVGILYETDKYLRQRFMRVDLAKCIQG